MTDWAGTVIYANGLNVNLDCPHCQAVTRILVQEEESKQGIRSTDTLACSACNATVDVSALSAA